MKKSLFFGAMCGCVFVLLIPIPSQAELIDNGGGLIYDDVLDITWAQPDTVRWTWDTAIGWAENLTLGGVSGWRLPYISVAAGAGPFEGTPVDCESASEADCRDNELGYMYWHNLGGTGDATPPNGDADALALFPSLLPMHYWSGSEYSDNRAWAINFGFGGHYDDGKGISKWRWAVHEGNVVPVPTAEESWGTIKAMYK